MNTRHLTLCATLLLGHSLNAHAQEPATADFWQIQTSAYTHHFSYNPEHNDRQKLLAIEYDDASRWLFGGAIFRNSFDQPSQYAYLGKRFDSQSTPLYLKITGGLLHGYRGDYKNKIPLNRYGIAPAVIPSLGLHVGPATAEVTVLGNAAVMLNVGWRL